MNKTLKIARKVLTAITRWVRPPRYAPGAGRVVVGRADTPQVTR